MSEKQTYQFAVTENEETFGADRFTLLFELNTTIPDISQTENVLTSTSTTGNQWYKDGVAINGETSQTLKISESGSYHVVVTSGDCELYSNNLELTITGLHSDLEKSIQLYPNPVEDYLTIGVADDLSTESLSASLWNVSGKLLISQHYEEISEEIKIDMRSLNSGVYILKIASEKESYQFRVIKN